MNFQILEVWDKQELTPTSFFNLVFRKSAYLNP